MTRRFFIKILLALGLGNLLPAPVKAETLHDNFKMLVFADSQCVDYNVWKKVSEVAIKKFPDAELFTVIGDLVDNGEADWQWRDWFNAADKLLHNRIFLPVCGNHECYNLDWKFALPTKFLNHFNTTHFYKFDFGAATFFVLNNNFEELNKFLPELQTEQENFLRREVPQSNGWKIVLMHKDIFNYAENKFNDIAEIFMPLFDELKIDLVLTGHLHTYRNRGKIFNFQKSDNGTCYILCGRAGDQKYLENISDFDEVTFPDADKVFEPETFIEVDITEKNLTLQCLTVEGEIVDKFTLEKV